MDWIREHRQVVDLLIFGSVGMFVASLFAVPWVIARLPADYFAMLHPPPLGWHIEHPLARLALLVLRTVLGLLLVAVGFAMLVLPGQGLIAIVLGLGLMTFPGKRRLELAIVRRPAVLRLLNWIRQRARREPFRVHTPS